MPSILAVDDSVSMRQLVSATLVDAGFDVVQAVDGEDALAKAKSAKIDLVLTDVNMPKMDGIELIRQLRAQPDFRFTPMLMLTTESAGERRRRARLLGPPAGSSSPSTLNS